jgi:ribosomal protein S18 acetylase RimI-like enzyme
VTETPAFTIKALEPGAGAEERLEALLRLVYVGGGFTDASLADSLFAAANVRARGDVLAAYAADGRLVGSVVVVPAGSPASRFAASGEVELQLLAVHPDQQGRGIGSALVDAAIAQSRSSGATRILLWTQPSMTAAQALYLKHGFVRMPSLDFARGERTFRVYARPMVDHLVVGIDPDRAIPLK